MPVALRLGLLMAGVAEDVRYQRLKPRRFSESGVRLTTGKRYKVDVCPSRRVATTGRQWPMKRRCGPPGPWPVVGLSGHSHFAFEARLRMTGLYGHKQQEPTHRSRLTPPIGLRLPQFIESAQ